MATQTLLELANLNRVSVDGTSLLCDVSLRVEGGQRTALSGKSGSGKTLLLRSLCALDPVGDHLRWRGRPIPAKNVPEFRSHVIYLQQRVALPVGTVMEALQEPFQWAANSGLTFQPDAATEMLQRVHRTASFLDKQTTDLSGGEAGLVAIMRALQLRATVLLLDEPTAAMDQETTRLVETLMQDWVADSERAYVWVTHDMEQASRVSNRTVQLLDGRVAP